MTTRGPQVHVGRNTADPDPGRGDVGTGVESGSHQDLLRQRGLYAELYNEQFEGGRVQWCCEGGDVMADGSVRERRPLPA